MATPHNEAAMGDIAETVIMPGDPLRAKKIAETYLSEVTQFNRVRNMYGYTGVYQGRRLSVMGSGMGMPSMGIYAYELFQMYGVDQIIRIGSAGAYAEECHIFDTLLVEEAYSESSFAKVQNGYEKENTYPSASLNAQLKGTAKRLGKKLICGKIHSTDVFYRMGDPEYYRSLWEEKHCLAVEMETFALFHTADMCGKKAACLLTISDSFVTKEETDAQEREHSFTDMMEIALETAKNL